MNDIERLLTITEVAEILRVPRARAYELVRSAAIPGVRVGRQVRVARLALTEFIATGGKALAGGWRREAQ